MEEGLAAKTSLVGWKARSRRGRNWRIILPFAKLALDDADHIAEALRARGGFHSP